MAASKKSRTSKRTPAKSKTAASKITDAVIVEGETSSVPAVDKVSETVPVEPVIEETVVDEPGEDSIGSELEKSTSDEVAAEQKTQSETAESKPMPVEEKRSIFLPLVLGGIVAGGLGFAASEYNIFGNGGEDVTAQLRTDMDAQQGRLVALEAAEIPTVDLSPLETSLAELQTGIVDIDMRLAAIEERPALIIPDGVDAAAVGEAAAASAATAYAAELATLKDAVDIQRNEIEALLNNAKTVEQATAEAATTANAQAAIAKIVSALDAGQSFDAEVSTLQSLDIGEVDPALTAVAAEGVATLSTLQSEFPHQARNALATARASGVEEGQQGLGGFLKRSLGARSVAPREGNDPDAVLSRAEAAIKRGDLNATLTELDALPEEAQAAIADWRTAADARVTARAAADALAQRLTAD